MKIASSLKAATGWPWPRLLTGLALLVFLLLGAWGRLYRLDQKSLWSDEIATIATSRGNAVDPDAFRLHGKRFDPPMPVPAAVYYERMTRLPDNHQEAPMTERFGRVASVLKNNVHPPLFFCLMSWWISLVQFERGISPTWLRLPAAFFGILSVLVMFGLARSLFRAAPQASAYSGKHRWATVLATVFFACSAYQMDHAQDARPYTLLLLIALLSAWVVVEPLRRSPGKLFWWVVFALLLTTGLYTQYFFGLFAITMLLFTGLQLVFHVRIPAVEDNSNLLSLSGLWPRLTHPTRLRWLLNWVGSVLIVGVLFSLWMPYFKTQCAFFHSVGHYTSGLWKVGPLPEKIWRILCSFVMASDSWAKIVPLVLFPLAMTAWFMYRSRHPHGKSLELAQQFQTGLQTPVYAEAPDPYIEPELRLPWISYPTAFMLTWLLVPLFGQIALDVIKDTHTATVQRYLLLICPAWYLLLSLSIVGLSRWIKRPWGWLLSVGFAAGILTFTTLDTFDFLFHKHLASDEFKLAARRVNHFYRPGDLLLVNKSGAMAAGMAYYLHRDIPMLGVDIPTREKWDDFSGHRKWMVLNQLSPAIADYRRIWVAYAHSAPSAVKGLNDWLLQKGFWQVGLRKFPGVNVYEFRSAAVWPPGKDEN